MRYDKVPYIPLRTQVLLILVFGIVAGKRYLISNLFPGGNDRTKVVDLFANTIKSKNTCI